jgi:sugar/nucleoside kinase (ribokinase family)
VIDLLVVGDCNPDLILAGGDVVPEFGQQEKLVDEARLVPGGSAAIMAAGASRLGLPTSLVAAVGDDLFGRFMLDFLTERGVDVRGCVTDPDTPTGLTVALVRHDDRAMLTILGAIPRLRADQVDPGRLRRATHLHVASYFLLDDLRPGLLTLVEAARASGATVSLNPQGDPSGGWDDGLGELLRAVDVLFVNQAEAAAIDTGECRLVVIKRGERGASACGIDVAPPPTEVVDATGAGDSFDAGFLAGWLNGEPLEQALRLGCACGALSTRALGGTAAQPTLEEARAVLR